MDINLLLFIDQKEYRVYQLTGNTFLVKPDDSDSLISFVSNKKYMVMCYKRKVQVFNPLGTLMRKVEYEEDIEDCFFNHRQFTSLFIMFKDHFLKTFVSHTLKVVKQNDKQKGYDKFHNENWFRKGDNNSFCGLEYETVKEECRDIGFSFESYQLISFNNKKSLYILF